MSKTLTAVEIEQLARFDEHWRVCLAGNNRLLAMALAKRGYLDVLKRWMPLYRPTWRARLSLIVRQRGY